MFLSLFFAIAPPVSSHSHGAPFTVLSLSLSFVCMSSIQTTGKKRGLRVPLVGIYTLYYAFTYCWEGKLSATLKSFFTAHFRLSKEN
jgi:hypothetical protein